MQSIKALDADTGEISTIVDTDNLVVRFDHDLVIFNILLAINT